MMDLKIPTGVAEYDLNGKVKVHFNPTDSAFVERLTGAFPQLEGKEGAYKSRVAEEADLAAVLATARKADSDMRAVLDGLFDVPVCGALFGDMNVYAVADGLPVWCNLLLACLDVVYANMDGLEDGLKRRVESITARYRKKYGD